MARQKKNSRAKAVKKTVHASRVVSQNETPRDKKINASFSDNALKMMRKRYLQKNEKGIQETPAQLYRRVSDALASVEKKYGRTPSSIMKIAGDFFDIMANKEFTPAGRTLTNSGASTRLVASCIVLPVLDSMESIFATLKDAALLQQAGSGLGFDFSHLRPAFTRTSKSNGVASGPVSFLKVYNEAFSVIKQQGRHGANMAMMQIDHPDILDFIRSKEVEGEVRNFNISIKVTDVFMKALIETPDKQWYCSWKGEKMKPRKVLRANNGSVIGVEELTITVKEIFDELVNYAWLNGEPGIVFIDEVNRTNPLPGLGPIDASNPCGEQFLHHYDVCNLGAINLATFEKNGKVNWNRLAFVTKTAIRMLDNVIDTYDFPVDKVTEMAQKNRRIGLGIMGFADLLYRLGIAYDSPEGIAMGERLMKAIGKEAHKASATLAKEKGAFPNYTLSIFPKKKVKMRNAALTTVQPTGSIAMFTDCSSGIEPNFALAFIKQDKDGHQYPYLNTYFAEALEQSTLSKKRINEIKEEVIETGSIQNIKDIPEKLKKVFVVSMDISAEDHMGMQAAFQRHVDNSISKTINFPNNATKEEVFNGYVSAWKLKCKSCTVYRDGSRDVQILNIGKGDNIIAPAELGSKPQAESTSQTPALTAGKLEPRIRPQVISGKTYKMKTGYGNLYITVNDDELGAPFEVFAAIGKSGGFFQEQSEAICRLISLSLRSGVKVETIIEHIKGIRGPMPVMTDKGTILSLPDAIGRILEDHMSDIVDEEDIEEEKLIPVSATPTKHADNLVPKMTVADYGFMPGCPDCGAHLQMAEGCMSCRQCGYSRCM